MRTRYNSGHQHELSSSFTDQRGEQTLNSAVLGDLRTDQAVHHRTRIVDQPEDTPNILDLLLTCNHSTYSIKLLLSLGLLIIMLSSVFFPIAPVLPLDTSKVRCFWGQPESVLL